MSDEPETVVERQELGTYCLSMEEAVKGSSRSADSALLSSSKEMLSSSRFVRSRRVALLLDC